jgi:hypothetical protein
MTRIIYPSKAEILGDLALGEYETAGFSGSTMIGLEDITAPLGSMIHVSWFSIEADEDIILTLDGVSSTMPGGQQHKVWGQFAEVKARADSIPTTMSWAGAGPCLVPEEIDHEALIRAEEAAQALAAADETIH